MDNRRIEHIEIALCLLKEANKAAKDAFEDAYVTHNYESRIMALIEDFTDIIEYKESNHVRY